MLVRIGELEFRYSSHRELPDGGLHVVQPAGPGVDLYDEEAAVLRRYAAVLNRGGFVDLTDQVRLEAAVTDRFLAQCSSLDDDLGSVVTVGAVS